MNDSYQLIYGIDEEFSSRTDDAFTSLFQGATQVLSEENVGLWKDQETVESLKDNWQETLRFYGREEFEESSLFASRAKSDILTILREGERETVTPNLIPEAFLYQGILVLLGLLVLVYIINHREKLKGMLEPSEGKEVDLTEDWKKEY